MPARQLAASFRTVRTIQVAEDIPEDKYSFTPAEGARPAGQALAKEWVPDPNRRPAEEIVGMVTGLVSALLHVQQASETARIA